MIVRNRPFAFVRPKESSQPVSSPMQRRSNTDGTKFQYGWNQVPVRMEPSSSTDGTKHILSAGSYGLLQISSSVYTYILIFNRAQDGWCVRLRG